MNNKTFETIQQTITRFETILEVDNTLSQKDRELITQAIANLVKVYESTIENHTP